MLILAVGLLASLMQAWGSIAALDYSRMNPPYLDGVIDDSWHSFRPDWGHGPVNENGHTWAFKHFQFDNGVRIVDIHRHVTPQGEHGTELFALANPQSGPEVLPLGSRARSQPRPFNSRDPDNTRHQELWAGWPMTAWSGTLSTESVNRTRFAWCFPYITRSKPHHLGPRQYALLPYRPVFPGAIVNVVFYGTLLLAIWVLTRRGFGAARRTIRRWRSRCPACGYAAGDLDRCPECGEPRAAAPRDHPPGVHCPGVNKKLFPYRRLSRGSRWCRS